MDEIEHDPKAPQGLAGLLGQSIVRGLFIAGDTVPGIRKGLEYVPKEAAETQASEWATYLAQKLTNKDEQVLVQDPVIILTPLFFKDLNDITAKRRCLLCFENFEATRDELQGWILRLREWLFRTCRGKRMFSILVLVRHKAMRQKRLTVNLVENRENSFRSF